ncbi:MAG: PadR family transcriptional regulator [Candidatus Odinarchaeota archaeon]
MVDGDASLVSRMDKDARGSLTVLLMLAIIEREGKTWGYRIRQKLAELTGNDSILDSTLYAGLKALEKTYGLVKSEREDRRRYYVITERGKKQLEEARDYWWELFAVSRKAFHELGFPVPDRVIGEGERYEND